LYQKSAAEKGATVDQSELLGQTRPESRTSSAIQSMYFAHLQLISEMQEYGYHYCGEDVGLFGLRRSGPGIAARLDSLFLWGDSYVAFDRAAIRKEGHDPDDIFFRGLAYRVMWNLYWNFSRQTVSFSQVGGTDDDNPTPWHKALLRAFDQAEGCMLQRHVLPADQGVRYRGRDGDVLWAFSSFEYPLKPKQRSRNLVTGASFTDSPLRAEKYGVYEILPSVPSVSALA
jgi:hypothetical protein